MKLQTLQQHWNALGEDDPLWAILSLPGKRGGVWDVEEFFATGPVQVNMLLAELQARGIEFGRQRALDFGCGIGRLTQALAQHFELSDGVDLAPSMIEQAIRANRQGERCRFQVNPAPDLRLFADQSFDLVLSLLVFQHMEPELMRGYVREFIRVLRPDGVAVFNVPDHLVLGTDLPRDAARAAIECRWTPRTLAPGEAVSLPLTVRNDSAVPWPAAARLAAGNHWLRAGGAILVHDDGRATIESTVPAGGRHDIELVVAAPHVPGSYELELDLLQEHKGWFATLGSPTTRLAVDVSPPPGGASASPVSAPAAAPGAEIFVPRIEMHVMSRDEMLAVIEDAGGVALDVIPCDRCGPEAPSYDYVIARAGPDAARSAARVESAAGAADRPARPAPAGLWEAGVMLDLRADVASFPLSSARRVMGRASVVGRRVLRRALREVLYRQTEFNRAAASLLHDQERQIERLNATLTAQEEMLTAAHRRIEKLERRSAQTEGPPDSSAS